MTIRETTIENGDSHCDETVAHGPAFPASSPSLVEDKTPQMSGLEGTAPSKSTCTSSCLDTTEPNDAEVTCMQSENKHEEIDISQTSTVNSAGRTIRWIRTLAGKIVNNSRFQSLIVILIIVNAILMGVATFNLPESALAALETSDQVFLIIFTLELGMQFIYRGLRLFTDGWLLFDFFIVVVSWSLEGMQIVRTFRIFRVLRLITRVEVLRNLVAALFAVAPNMIAITCLLILIIYIYGVMCTILFKDLYQNGETDLDYFSRLDISLWTLLGIMTLEWSGIARQVMAAPGYGSAWLVFVSYIFLTGFVAYNLIIAVVCDSVSVIEHMKQKQAHEEEIESEKHQIRRLKERVESMKSQQEFLLDALREVLRNTGVSSDNAARSDHEDESGRVFYDCE
jgi:hypothetical protein